MMPSDTGTRALFNKAYQYKFAAKSNSPLNRRLALQLALTCHDTHCHTPLPHATAIGSAHRCTATDKCKSLKCL